MVGPAFALTAVGCGSSTSTADSEKIAELEQRVEDAESRAADADVTADDSAASDVASDVGDDSADDTQAEDASAGGDCIKVPNVVGKDHQLAQDTMQAAGLYLLGEKDASGQGRMLLVDRNWTTVRQRPKAGACVSEDTEIMLCAVKDGER